MSKKILITGGAGFIGSHTYISMVNAGLTPLILDNFSNSSQHVIERLSTITNTTPNFIDGDVRNPSLLEKVFAEHQIYAVIHFAGLKAVGESVKDPLDYYDNNVLGTLNLLAAMRKAKVKTFVFSSSATVYGSPKTNPINEDFPRSATNPYGRTKLMVEDILEDLHRAEPNWDIARLRYFNPVGAHESGLIGEDPRGTPNNLMPYIAQVAIGQRDSLNVFGNDYTTFDGTGVRDYIHVMDLAEGHVAALKYLTTKGGLLTLNLGTGEGFSVLDMITTFEKASGKKIPYTILDRRAGDIAECWADPTLADTLIGWKARRSLLEMCKDSWNWQKNNENFKSQL